MKTLIVGDAHLGGSISMGIPGIGLALNSRIVDQNKLLNWILEQALDKGAAEIIFTGDVFEDPRPDFILVNLLFEFLKKCESNKIDVHIIAGNHDIRRSGSVYHSVLDLISTISLPNAFFYKDMTTLHRKNVSFTLMPFRDRRALDFDNNNDALSFLGAELNKELNTIPESNKRVIIGHLALEGSLYVGNELDSGANELICPLYMFSNCDFCFMGHIHKPQVRSEYPYIAHIGSLDLSDFGETDHVKILVLFDNDSASFEEIPVPSRPLRRINLDIPLKVSPTEYLVKYINLMNESTPFKGAIVKIDIHILDPEAQQLNRKTIEELILKLEASHICSFSESKNLNIIPLSKQEDIDNTITYKSAVTLFAEKFKFNSDDDKAVYIETANSIIDKHLETLK